MRPTMTAPSTSFTPADLSANGVPDPGLVVVDLDRLDGKAETGGNTVHGARQDWFAGAAATLGVATLPLRPAALAVARRLTCSVATRGAAAAEDGSPIESCLVEVDDVAATVAALEARAAQAPRATVALDGLLRLTEVADTETGVVAESFAYSMLLASPEFGAWRSRTPRRARAVTGDPVRVSRTDDHRLEIVLDRPARGNAFSADLRAALVDALRLAALDTSLVGVRLSGVGRHFSTGGDLDEFGTAPDPGAAHAIRLDQSAGLAVHRVAERTEVHLHGRCIGAGIEVPAFAGRVVAAPQSTFQLPELGFGLVPGAGGTVSVARRVGRWRTAYLVLSGAELDVSTALTWGLVDAVL